MNIAMDIYRLLYNKKFLKVLVLSQNPVGSGLAMVAGLVSIDQLCY